MTIEQAIEKAIKGGWNPEVELGISTPTDKEWEDMIIPHGTQCAVFLSPSFWQSLGKAMGWGQKIYRTTRPDGSGERICLHCGVNCSFQPSKESGCSHIHYPEACDICLEKSITWKQRWHYLIDHLADGGDIKSYFEKL